MKLSNHNFVVFFITILVAANLSAETDSVPNAKSIYQAILKENGLEDKKKLGMDLGKLGSEEYILKLLKEESYWDRHAGISASKEFSSEKINQTLIDLYLEDYMTDDETGKLIEGSPDKFAKLLLGVYGKSKKSEDKKKILEVLRSSNSQEVISLYKKEINDPKSKFRSEAFDAFSANNWERENLFFRSFLEDKTLRYGVIKFIHDHGSKEDKPFMLELLKQKSTPAGECAVALNAIKKWGSYSEQEAEFLRSLQKSSNDDGIKIYSISLFGEMRSEPVRAELCKIADSAKSQNLRLLAAETLVGYQDVLNRPCLKKIAEEAYHPNRSKPGADDFIFAVLTLGFSNIVKGIRENNNRNEFLSRQSLLKKHLSLLDLKANDTK
ncbi:hypothetical protein [Leptospira sp. 'Mane']|uniref:hypothetical protein n=1 Tax=Leptospira sp. 'Mane' TaxID=3387407 RepID=UPI00398B94C0